jgi:hypothetical protein
MGYLVNQIPTSGNCVVQNETERPQPGNRIAGPYATRQEAENKKEN